MRPLAGSETGLCIAVVASTSCHHQGGTAMKRNLKLLFGMAIIFAILTPQFLFAQDGISLESLSERIDTLFQGQNDSNKRISALETRQAPTPTKTRRPTRTPTSTRQRPPPTATRNVEATATARARYRATQVARANAKKSGISESEYEEKLTEMTELATAAMIGINASFNRPQLNNQNWHDLLNIYLETLTDFYDSAKGIKPPASLQSAHNVFVQGAKHCANASALITDGLKKRDGDLFAEAANEIDECTRLVGMAVNMMQ